MQDKNNASLCEQCLFSYEGVRYSDGTKQLICALRAVDNEVTAWRLERCTGFVRRRGERED